ncbi:UDP-N-acetylmuramoyl-tripeptide--D-alanyl-D-alanine ligase [uncultured Draconibacterium sp.]|uniref:UDP-N-acetylmuramoyl-tripeptide--D-alanyl-D- alanine ligase n=1 Tax=uncultured Draconibacterium sp. TaxID=1573823 RepID=UPI003216A9FC
MMSTEELYKIFLNYPVISTDSRKIEKGSLFFALKGENFNGNKYAADAISKGAAYSIIDEEDYHIGENTILVNNVLKALQKLANYHRKQLRIPILGITGTNGKTTTKELIASVLAKKFLVSFTQGNLNNHIGVPLTLLAMNSETEFGVVEMGANHPGEIAELCKIADPDYGIITNIGQAHLEGFGSFDGVKRTKSELYKYIRSKGGTIFYNSDNPILAELNKEIKNKISYGRKDASFIGEPIQSPPFIHVKANFEKGVLYLNSNLIGDFNFENILAAACIANYFKVDPLKIQMAIKAYHPTNNRSQLIQKGKLKIIMDAYNANPTSMSASIASFLRNLSGDNYMILGDMLELGEYSAAEHAKIIELIPESITKNTFLVGNEFSKAGERHAIKTFMSVSELNLYLAENPIKNGNLLIKGSRGIQLEKILEILN